MASTLFVSTFALFAFLNIRSSHCSNQPCPFNGVDCVCATNDSTSADPSTFSTAVCKSVDLPALAVSSSGTKYSISSLAIRSDNVYKIPANYFGAFESIEQLLLKQTGKSGPISQEWDQNAFADVEIQSISIEGLDGILPPPASLVDLGGRNLRGLSITGSSSLTLSDNAFKDFPSLSQLTLLHTPISGITDQAFAGLENSLEGLSLNDASLSAAPSTALSILTKLDTLNLQANKITQIPSDAYSKLVGTKSLSLEQNPVSDISADAFQPLTGLTRLDLAWTALPSVNLSLFAQVQSEEPFKLMLDNCDLLKAVTISDSSKFPNKADITVTDTSLDTVDSKLGDVMTSRPSMTVDFGDVVFSQCQALDWMAPHVLCTRRLLVQGATCTDKDGELLEEYLRSIAPDMCPDDTTTAAATESTSTDASAPTAATVPTTSKGASQPFSWASLIVPVIALAIFLPVC